MNAIAASPAYSQLYFPLNGIYPYEFSKSATDMMCKTYRTTYNLPVTVLRCGNIYGGGDLNWDRLIPGVIRWLINNETPVLRVQSQVITPTHLAMLDATEKIADAAGVMVAPFTAVGAIFDSIGKASAEFMGFMGKIGSKALILAAIFSF